MPWRSRGESSTCHSEVRWCCGPDVGPEEAVRAVPYRDAEAIMMRNVDVRGAIRWDKAAAGVDVAVVETAWTELDSSGTA